MENLSLELLSSEALSWMPDIVKVILVFLFGWLIAKGLKKLTFNLLNRTGLDDKLLGSGTTNIKSEVLLSKLVYYLVMAIVLMTILNMIGADSALDPLREMVTEFFSAVPNIIKALIIGFVGYIVAQTGSALVNLSGNIVDRLALRAGVKDTMRLTKIIKNFVFLLIIIPFGIAALEALHIPSISEPASDMLRSFMSTIPNIIAASFIIAVFYYGGKFFTSLLKDLLQSLGTDQFSSNLKLNEIIGTDRSLSQLLAQLAFFFIMFFGVITAVNKLGFEPLTDILETILSYAGSILFGLIIFALGNYLANVAYKSMSKPNESNMIPSVVKGAILALFFAMGLRTMGFANEIVHLAFGLILGAVAVAFALSFGLGGQKAAGEIMQDIADRIRTK